MRKVEFGEIATFSQGQQVSIPDQKTEKFDGCDTFLRIVNYTQNSDDFRYIPKQSHKHRVSTDDIIMVRYGAVGFVGRGLSGVLANNMFKINFDKDQVDGNYLFRILWSDFVQKQLLNASQSTSMAAINFKTTSKITIPLPQLDQQKKIAAILDAADAYRQKTKALIEKYDELTQSLFLKMFGDPVGNPKGLPTEQLGDLCEFYSGRAWKKGELGDKGYKLVRISNLHKPNFPYWLYDGELIEKHKIERGDLLFSWAGVQASIDVYIYEGEVAMLNQHIYNIKPKRSDISKLYLFNLLQLHLDNLRKSLGGGVGQFHLKKSDITSIKVLIPDFISMKKYMQSLDSLVNQKAQAQASLLQAEDLFNSLLQRAFKGELTT